LLTAAEIARAGVATAYEAVFRLRPRFFATRGSKMFSATRQPSVFVDEVRAGGTDALRLIHAAEIDQIRLFEPWEAESHFGSGNFDGVIAVTLLH
jgi:hypothetical protein